MHHQVGLKTQLIERLPDDEAEKATLESAGFIEVSMLRLGSPPSYTLPRLLFIGKVSLYEFDPFADVGDREYTSVMPEVPRSLRAQQRLQSLLLPQVSGSSKEAQ